MNPSLRHRREPRFTGRLSSIPRSLLWVVIAAGLALAAPAGAQRATGSTYGPVQPADTLWALALRFRGSSSVNAQQAMIAILRANPEAFREGNINALRTRVTLRVPSVAEIEAISPAEAAAEFARHEVAWRNRRRTGSAAPAPGPASPARQAPARPASAPAEPPVTIIDETAAELREARATVADLRQRLAERDEAIEELLVQLAAVRRELRPAPRAEPAPSGEPGGREEDEARRDSASRSSWLPVSPLVLGSSLIVLLVLIVVVTLIRQRGEPEERYPEEGYEGEEEEPYEEDDEELHGGEEETHRDHEKEFGEEDRGPGSWRAGGAPAAGAVAAGTMAAFPADEKAGDPMDDESTDLPFGIDLEGGEDWGPAPEEPSPGRPELPESEDPSEFGRHVEVGELDNLDLDTGPAPGSSSSLPAGDDEEDDPPEGGGHGRPAVRRRE